MAWQVQSGGGWQDLDEEAARLLDQAARRGEKRLLYQLKGLSFEVALDVRPFVQTSVETGIKRHLRHWAQGQAAAVPVSPEADLTEVPGLGLIESLRVSVWRGADWHPVPQSEERQIKAQLQRGLTMLEVQADGGTTYLVDTTGKSGWEQVLAGGRRRRRMKAYQALLSLTPVEPTAAPPAATAAAEAQGGGDLGSSGTDATPPQPTEVEVLPPFSLGGPSMADSAAAAAVLAPRLVDLLREEFRTILGGSGGQRPRAGEGDLTRAWVARAGRAAEEDAELLQRSAADVFLHADLAARRGIEEAEWLHFRLMRVQAPSWHAVEQVNALLKTKMRSDSAALAKLMDLFLACCSQESQDALVSVGRLRDAARRWLEDGNQGPSMESLEESLRSLTMDVGAVLGDCGLSPIAPRVASRSQSRSQSFAQSSAREPRGAGGQLAASGGADGEEMLTYYDFMNIMLARSWSPVQLYRYDLSNGKAKWLSPVLIGQSLDGIWHTGICFDGREYWFGGTIFESDAGTTPFGDPTVVQTLGETMRTREDLWDFIQTDLVDEYTVDNYDILTHNCNHFSNALCKFLLNAGLPDDIMKQPELFMNSWLSQMLRPTLNRSLGRFGPEQGRGRATDAKGAQSEWDRILIGSLVTYEYMIGWKCIARVTAKARETCDLKWLDLSERQLRAQRGVSRLHVRLVRTSRTSPLNLFGAPSPRGTAAEQQQPPGQAQDRGAAQEAFHITRFMEQQLGRLGRM